MDKRTKYLKPGRLFILLIGILLSASLSAHYNVEVVNSYALAVTTLPNPAPGQDLVVSSGVTITISANEEFHNVIIEAGGILILSGTTTLTVTGNWTNNGTFTAGTSGTVEFTGSLDANITGTTEFKYIRFSKDPGKKVIITGPATTASGGNLTLSSGAIEISGSLICNHNVNLNIPVNTGITISGGTFSTTASIENYGNFTLNAGTVTIGSVTGNSFFIGNNGTFSISGGTLNVAGRFQVSGGTANISGGTINLNSLGHNSSSIATLDLSLTAVFNMTAGTINIVRPNSTGNSDIIIRNSTGSKNFTGGNIFTGTGVSATYLFTSQIPFPATISASGGSSLTYRMLVSANGTYNFPLNNNTLPVSVTISGTSYTNAFIEVTTSALKHPNNANTGNFLNRFWNVTVGGVTNPNYSLTAAYADPADITGDELKIAAGIWGGGLPWTKQGVANSGANTISLAGITATSLQFTGLNNDLPTVSISANPSATICQGTSTTLTATATGDPGLTYSWSPATGLSATNISNPVASPSATTTYTVTVTDGNGFTASDNITITVYPQFVAGTISDNQTICHNTAPAQLSGVAPTGGNAPYTYQWQMFDGSNWNDISGANSLNYSPGALTATTQYRLAQTSASGCGTLLTNTVTITVYPQFVAGTISANQTICHNTSPAQLSGVAPTGGNAPYTYQWQVFNGSIWNNISGATNLNYAPGALTATTQYRLAQTSASGCGTLLTNTITITVYPQFVAGTISANQTICHNTAPAQLIGVAPVGGNMPYTYQWQMFDGSNWNDISGANSLNYSPGALTATTQFRLAQTSASGCGTLLTNTVTITVYPQFVAGTTSANQSICHNTSPAQLTGVAPTGGNAPYTYQWQVFNGSIWNNISGATNLNYAPGVLTSTTQYRLAQTSANGCGTLHTNEVTITVNPRPVPTIAGLNPVCSGSTGITYTTEAGMSGYSWGISAGGTITSGAGTRQITVTWNVAGTQTLQVTYTDANGCTAVNPTILSITVNPTPVMTITNPPAVCAPSTVNLTTVSISSTVSITTREYYTDAAATLPLANPSAVGASGTYYIKGITSTGCFDIKPVTVTVHPAINLVITNPAAVCNPPATVDLTAATITAGSSAGLTYTYWTDAAATIPLANFTTVNTSGTYYIKGTAGTNCFDIKPVTVTVNPTPIITTANTKTICSGQNTNIALTASVPSTFAWTIGTITGTVTGAIAGSGPTISQVLTATGTGGSVQYLVTATGTTGNCPSPVYTITVTVNTPPVITTQPPTDQYICGNSSTTITASSTGSPTPSVQWQYSLNGTSGWTNVPSGLVPSPPNSGINGFTFSGVNNNLLQISAPDDDRVVFFRAVYTNSCGTATSNNSRLVVDKQGPFVQSEIDQTVACAGGLVTLTARIQGQGGQTEAWLQFNNNGVWENVPGTYMKSDNSGNLIFSATINTVNYPYNPEFRIYVTGKCGTVNTKVRILYLQSIVTVYNTCVGGSPVNFLLDGAITNSPINPGEGWTVTGGGTINPVTGLFTPTTPGCYSATYRLGNCVDSKPFVVFPNTSTLSLTGNATSSCGTRLPDIVPLPAVAGFTAEYAVQPPGGTLSAYGTLPAANALLTNTIGCWTIRARYRRSTDCSSGFTTIPAGTLGPCAEATLNAIVFPPKPVLTAPANTCNTAFTLPSAPTYTGFTPQYSINGGAFTNTPAIPATPGCHTIAARYILNAACGSTPAGADGGVSCNSDPVSVVIFPPAPTAPVVTTGCGIFSVTPPPTITGFNIEYSYNNGATWATTNQGPSAESCTGYQVKTRYVLASACGNTIAGTASSNPGCSESPATLRRVDNTPPSVICPNQPAPVCVNSGSVYINTGVGWDATVTDACPITSVSAVLTGATTGTYTTLNGVAFNQGVTTVTWTASDGCNTQSCSFTVTVNPVPVISNMTATICSGGTFTVTPINGTNGTVPAGTTYSWLAPSVPGITGTLAGSNQASITGTLVNTTTSPINVVYTVAPLSGNCGGTSFTVTVTVNPVLVCTITGPDGPLCPSTTHTYSAVAGMSGYSWGITGNATINGATNQATVTVLTGSNCNGSFTLTLTYNDTNGCSSNCQKTVTVIDNAAPVIGQQPQIGSFVCSSSDPDQNAAYLTWLSNNGGATATDNCDNTLTWTNNSTTQPWVIDMVNHTRAKTVTFTVTDDCSNSTSTQAATFTITDDVAPVFTFCPPNVEEQIAADLCSKTGVTIGIPIATDNCSTPTFSYILTGVTTGTANGLIPASQVFNVGVTTVNYIATDAVGNTATCEFTVWIKRLDIPAAAVTCPPDPAAVTVAPDECSAQVTLARPAVNDPCNSIVSVVHNSTIGTAGDPSGVYPIGITTVTWTITDNSGNTLTCTQTVVVNDLPLVCPQPITAAALPLFDYATVTVPHPGFSNTCSGITLTYKMVLTDGITEVNSPATGVNFVPSPSNFYIGVTTITYTITHATGTTETCTFTVTVTSRPYITCPASLTRDADAGECDATLDPGVPTLVQGAQPIDWTWSMLLPDNTVLTGGSTTTFSDPIPDPIVATAPHEFAFPVGTTTITWTATNLSGADTCTHTITVADTQPPVLTPPDPFEFCVENLMLAVYNGSDLDINPDPDHYLLRAGSTDLDLDMSLFNDNCCLIGTHPYGIRWQIDFDGTEPSVSGTGQPSTHPNDIELWGDGITHLDRVHTITYWVTDCHGIETGPYVVDITIKPRPQIIKN
jgi:hypothetical protein